MSFKEKDIGKRFLRICPQLNNPSTFADVTVVASETPSDQRLLARRERADRERSEVRARILRSARNTLRKGSMFDLTIMSLASDVGVSRQTIYRHFPTVQDVFRALSDEVIADIYSKLPDLPFSDPGYITAFVDRAVKTFCADSKVVRVSLKSGCWQRHLCNL